MQEYCQEIKNSHLSLNGCSHVNPAVCWSFCEDFVSDEQSTDRIVEDMRHVNATPEDALDPARDGRTDKRTLPLSGKNARIKTTQSCFLTILF